MIPMLNRQLLRGNDVITLWMLLQNWHGSSFCMCLYYDALNSSSLGYDLIFILKIFSLMVKCSSDCPAQTKVNLLVKILGAIEEVLCADYKVTTSENLLMLQHYLRLSN